MNSVTYISITEKQLEELIIKTSEMAVRVFEEKKSKMATLNSKKAALYMGIHEYTWVRWCNKGHPSGIRIQGVFRNGRGYSISDYDLRQFKKALIDNGVNKYQ